MLHWKMGEVLLLLITLAIVSSNTVNTVCPFSSRTLLFNAIVDTLFISWVFKWKPLDP